MSGKLKSLDPMKPSQFNAIMFVLFCIMQRLGDLLSPDSVLMAVLGLIPIVIFLFLFVATSLEERKEYIAKNERKYDD